MQKQLSRKMTTEELMEFIYPSGNELRTDSRKVAEVFGKRHGDVLRAIKNLKFPDELKGFTERNFAFCYETNDLQNNKPQLYCEMTKNGFILLVMGFTGEDAMLFKIGYIEAFDLMADNLRMLKQGLIEELMNAELTEQLSFAEASKCGKGLNIRRHQKAENHKTIAEIKAKIQPDLFDTNKNGALASLQTAQNSVSENPNQR